jgi:hypothetical protein
MREDLKVGWKELFDIREHFGKLKVKVDRNASFFVPNNLDKVNC